MTRILPVLLSLLLSTAALAADPAVKATGAWARATAPGAPNGGVFLRIDNAGTSDDRLLRAASDLAKTVELHAHKMDGGVARMVAQPDIPVPAGKTVELAPGGLHVMLIGLVRPLREGERFPLTLQFEKAGSRQVEVTVQGVGAMGAAAGRH